MAEKISSWTPAWQVRRDSIVEDPELRALLLGNKSAKALSSLCSVANECKLAIQKIHQDEGSPIHGKFHL